MLVNGTQHPCRDGLTLHALLDDLQVDQSRVVVMHGDQIHRRGQLPDTPLTEHDVIEIVTMMQGG